MNDTLFNAAHSAPSQAVPAPANEWQPTVIFFPRVALCDTCYGLQRRLLWPGNYRVRISKRFGKPVYRR